MIKKIAFKNYKIFKEKQTLELAPITVLIGKNNSGKSAIAKLPILVDNCLKNSTNEPLVIINEGIEFGGELRDFIYGKANRILEIEVEFEIGSQTYNLSVGIGVVVENSKQTSHIEFWKLDNSIDLQYSGEPSIYKDAITGITYRCSFIGIRLISYSAVDKTGALLSLALPALDFDIDFIGPIRVLPKRDYRIQTSTSPKKSGGKGENTYNFLIEDALSIEQDLLKDVSSWYKSNFEGWEVKVNQDKAPIYQIELQKNSLRQNIRDTGIGMCQVLPIVTRVKKRTEIPTLIIIEEPEIHLHPAAHANLAELFVESITSTSNKYLIETHSLNFVLRLRRLIASKKIASKEIAIYYVDFLQDQDNSVIKKIQIDEDGTVKNWPEGVFNETLSETVAIRTAQMDEKK